MKTNAIHHISLTSCPLFGCPFLMSERILTEIRKICVIKASNNSALYCKLPFWAPVLYQPHWPWLGYIFDYSVYTVY